MRILWLSHLLPWPLKAGVIQRSYHMMRQLSYENEIDLIAFHQPNLMRPMVENEHVGLEDAKENLSKICNIISVHNINVDSGIFRKLGFFANALFSSNGYNLSWLISGEYEASIVSAISSKKYDLIHFDTISFMPYYKLFADIPVVLNHHNIESQMMKRRAEKEKNILKKIYLDVEAKRIKKCEVDYADRVSLNLVCSDLDKDRLKSISPSSKIITIPNGVDTNYFTPDKSSDLQSLIFIGTMNWYPNIEAVDFIISELAEEIEVNFPDLKIEIVGAGAPEWLIEKAERKSNVKMHGFVDEIRPMMNKAFAYICPIADGGGTKLKILDALSMGMPIIANPIACEGIDVMDYRDVLFASSKEDYIESLGHLKKLQSDKKYNQFCENARRLAIDKYSVDSIGAKLRDAYKSLSNKSEEICAG